VGRSGGAQLGVTLHLEGTYDDLKGLVELGDWKSVVIWIEYLKQNVTIQQKPEQFTYRFVVAGCITDIIIKEP
jgi:hypothetical protein